MYNVLSELTDDDKGSSEFEQVDVVVLLIVLSQWVVLRERGQYQHLNIRNIIYLLDTVVISSVSLGVLHGA